MLKETTNVLQTTQKFFARTIAWRGSLSLTLRFQFFIQWKIVYDCSIRKYRGYKNTNLWFKEVLLKSYLWSTLITITDAKQFTYKRKRRAETKKKNI